MVLVITSKRLLEELDKLNEAMKDLIVVQSRDIINSFASIFSKKKPQDTLIFEKKVLAIMSLNYVSQNGPEFYSMITEYTIYEKGSDSTYSWIDNAIQTVHNIYNNLSTDSLLFNVMSLVDSNVRYCILNRGTVFDFTSDNTHEVTHRHLCSLTQNKYVLFSASFSKAIAICYYGIIFINKHYFEKYDKNEKTSKLIATLIREYCHFKRSKYSSDGKLINDNSPLIKVPQEKHSPYDIGDLVEFVLYGKGKKYFDGNFKLFENEDIIKLLNYKNWLSDLRLIYQIGKDIYERNKSNDINNMISISAFTLPYIVQPECFRGNRCFDFS
jgi:hypothetical protein